LVSLASLYFLYQEFEVFLLEPFLPVRSMSGGSSLELAGLPEFFPGQSRLEAAKVVFHSGCMVLPRTTSLEFFPLQHISALENTFEPLRSIAGCDQGPALTLPSSGFLFTLLTVFSFQSLRRPCASLRALMRFPLQCFKTLVRIGFFFRKALPPLLLGNAKGLPFG
jgi:hypothetical protein